MDPFADLLNDIMAILDAQMSDHKTRAKICRAIEVCETRLTKITKSMCPHCGEGLTHEPPRGPA